MIERPWFVAGDAEPAADQVARLNDRTSSPMAGRSSSVLASGAIVAPQHNARLLETGRNRDPRRRNLTAADITVWDADPLVIAARQRLQSLIDQHPRPPDLN